MKVLFVSANTELINMPVLPLGMSCVARAAEDAGHDVNQINLMAIQDALSGLINTIWNGSYGVLVIRQSR